MRIDRLWMPMAILATSSLGLAQASLEPRRISHEFQGSLPVVWTLEGEGELLSAELRILDDAGVVQSTVKVGAIRKAGLGRWQIHDWASPASGLGSLGKGRYIAEWKLEWKSAKGVRTERVESVFRIEGKDEGWLLRAYMDGDLPCPSTAFPTNWQRGVEYPISLQLPAHWKVRYQLVGDANEHVLRPWTELPVGKGHSWRLPWDSRWPSGLAHLWMVVEDPAGRIWVKSNEVILGDGSVVPRKTDGHKGVAKDLKTLTAIVEPNNTGLPGSQAVVAETSLLDRFDPSVNPTPWEETNRVATVTAGSLDEERDFDPRHSLDRLWPSEGILRPLSLSITGANKLGRPLYSVSYLLDSENNDGNELANLAEAAVRNVGNGGLPRGAAKLNVGGVAAPVVFSGATIDDFLGKPLASGFGWAKFGDDPTKITTASEWSNSSSSAPEVGLKGITNGAAFKAQLIKDGIESVGYPVGSEPIELNATRLPYSINFISEDPTGRIVLSKAIGSAKEPAPNLRVDQVGDIIFERLFLGCNFLNGVTPNWVSANENSEIQVVSEAQARVVLKNPYTTTVTYDYTQDPNYPDVYTVTEDRSPGRLYIRLRTVVPGVNYMVNCTTSGRFRAYIKVGDTPITPIEWSEWSEPGEKRLSLSSSVFDGLKASGMEFPHQSLLVLENANPITTDAPDPSATSYVDKVEITGEIPLGLVAREDVLQDPSRSFLKGYTRNQFGTVSVPEHGICTVNMMTDPDGSAMAEVKDPEGRTIYKIVNPSKIFTDQFLDQRNHPFVPASPQCRGNSVALAIQNKLPSEEQPKEIADLVTQYLFDSEGHLRVVIPPKGILRGTWGFNLSSEEVRGAFSWNGAPGTLKPIPFATHNAYDYAGHLLATYSPDEGLTRFIVDQKGRVHYSQSESQRGKKDAQGNAAPLWTRTLYDEIFRVVAVGEQKGAEGTDFAGGVEELPRVKIFPLEGDPEFGKLISSDSRSINIYDTYQDFPADPNTVTDNPESLLWDTRVPVPLHNVLPHPTLWAAFADGHLTQTKDGRSIERYYYDQDGRIVMRWVTMFPEDEARRREFFIGIYYDFAGRVKRLVYPAGPTGDPLQVVYTYDDLGRLFAVGTPQDKAYFARYAYHPTGELRAIVYGPGEGFAAKRMLQDPQGWLRAITIQGRK